MCVCVCFRFLNLKSNHIIQFEHEWPNQKLSKILRPIIKENLMFGLKRKKRTLRKWEWGKSVERWEKTSSMGFEASHHDAQKCTLTAAPLATTLSSSALDCTSFTDPPILSQKTQREKEPQTLGEDFTSFFWRNRRFYF